MILTLICKEDTMKFMTLAWIGIGIGTIWLLLLSYIVYTMQSHYKNLISRTQKGSIDEILEVLLKKNMQVENNVTNLEKTIQLLDKESEHHYQKLGFLRFNPFERVGGDQSFVITLLDKKENGVLLNFLYTRDGIRVYAKRVAAGKGDEYELSAEEKEAIKIAH